MILTAWSAVAMMVLPWGCRAAPMRGEAARSCPFVASEMRMIVHATACRWAAKIPAGNLLGFSSREDAEAAGCRPCRVCLGTKKIMGSQTAMSSPAQGERDD